MKTLLNTLTEIARFAVFIIASNILLILCLWIDFQVYNALVRS